jgi:hypothetical protein
MPLLIALKDKSKQRLLGSEAEVLMLSYTRGVTATRADEYPPLDLHAVTAPL